MRNLKSLAMALGMGLFLFLPNAKADDWDKLTKITFSGPVRIEKTELPAGTYTFKIMDQGGDRNIVQIFNADETHLITTILANPDYRMEPTGKTVVKFAETSNGSETEGNVPVGGVPMKEWFYPGDLFGQQFPIKPVHVATTETTETTTTASAEPAPVALPQPETPVEAAPAPEPEPQAQTSTETTTTTEAPAPVQTEQQTTNTEQQSAPSELPQTASQMPLLGLIGILALAGAASLRIFLKISA